MMIVIYLPKPTSSFNNTEVFGPFPDEASRDAWITACQKEGWDGKFIKDRLQSPSNITLRYPNAQRYDK